MARYIERAPLSLEKLSIQDDIVTYTTKDGAAHEFDALEFLGQRSVHKPKTYESTTRYYGRYCALFQTANNTAVVADIQSDQRGVVSGLLSLSRSVGLMAGTAAMGAVFTFGIGTSDIATAQPGAVATGMQVTFLVATGLVLVGIVIAARAQHFEKSDP